MYSNEEHKVLDRIKEMERMRQFEDHKFFSNVCMDELWELILDLRTIVIKTKGKPQ